MKMISKDINPYTIHMATIPLESGKLLLECFSIGRVGKIILKINNALAFQLNAYQYETEWLEIEIVEDNQ